MIYRVLTISLVIMAFVTGYYYAVNKIGKTKQSLFAKKLHAHYIRLARNIDDKSVVFIGSSSIQGMDVSKVSPNGINLGIGGENIMGLYQRLVDYPKLNRAATIVIAAGMNDICHNSEEEIKSKYNALLTRINSKNVIISSIQPSRRDDLCPEVKSKIKTFNHFLESTCGTTPGCKYVNLAKTIRNDRDYYEIDGLHLNEKGYKAWYSLIKTELPAF